MSGKLMPAVTAFAFIMVAGLAYLAGKGEFGPAKATEPAAAVQTPAAPPPQLAAPVSPGAGAEAPAPQSTPSALAGLLPDEARRVALFEAARGGVVAISTTQRQFNAFARGTVDRPLASGSGFIWDGEGHVVTNAHVIEGASAATITLADGRSFDAQLVGRDLTHDLAVLAIDATDLPPPLPLGDSSGLKVGQNVYAIGNPFGLDWTLTTGIISALDRDLEERQGRISGLIQTDAAINPGNSGGPLLNSSGELIGVNTAILSRSGSSAGVGLAIPARMVSRVVAQLIETGHYTAPTLGLGFDARINAAVNRQGLEGALVLNVTPDSAAEAAGIVAAEMGRDGRIRPGDIVTSVDGAPVAQLDDLLTVIDRREPGSHLQIGLTRDGVERQVELELMPGA